jgi:hypothetical protein
MNKAIAVTILLALMAAGSARAQHRVKDAAGKLGFVNPDEPITVTALKHAMDNQTGIWTGIGDVTISNSAVVVHADQISLNQRTGDVQASGHVRLMRPGFGEWTGERIVFNHRTGAGLTDDSQVKIGRFTVQAESSERQPDGKVILRDVKMTTCTNAPGLWHWYLATGKASYQPNRSLSASHGSVWFMGVPIAYVPYFYRALDTHYGVRVMPGYTSDWGLFALGRYVYPYLSAPEGVDVTGQARVDYRSARGLGLGHDFKWDWGSSGKGRLELYYADDSDPDERRAFPKTYTDTDRYRIALEHAADLTDKDRVFVRGQLLSDAEMRETFFPAEYRRSVQPDNVLSYTHREANGAGGVTVSGPLDGFYNGVQRLPEAWLNIMPQSLFPGLYYESQTRFGYLQRQTSPRALGPKMSVRPPEYTAFRADTAQRLSLPFWAADLVRVVPRAGYHGTYYNHSRVSDSGDVRNLFELGTEASVKGTGTLGKYRHVVEPYVDYSWIPRPQSMGDGEPYLFDRYDSPREWRDRFGLDGLPLSRQWHGVRLGVRNALQDRDADGQNRTVVESDLYSAYSFGREGEPEGAQIIGGVLQVTPRKNLRYRSELEFDSEDHVLRMADNALFWRTHNWEWSGGHFFRKSLAVDPFGIWVRDPASQVLYGGVKHIFNTVWSAGTDVRYECELARLQEISGYVEYSLDCISFQIRTGYEPAWTDTAGVASDANFKIGFALKLVGVENRFGLSEVNEDLGF